MKFLFVLMFSIQSQAQKMDINQFYLEAKELIAKELKKSDFSAYNMAKEDAYACFKYLQGHVVFLMGIKKDFTIKNDKKHPNWDNQKYKNWFEKNEDYHKKTQEAFETNNYKKALSLQ